MPAHTWRTTTCYLLRRRFGDDDITIVHGGGKITPNRSVWTAFAWGVLVVGDAADRDIPSLEPDRTIVATNSTVVIKVRHAQDVADIDDGEFLVNVRVAAGVGTAGSREALLSIPSGQLFVGDANGAEIVELRPGPWRLGIDVEPIDLAERVTVWLTSASLS